MFGIGQAIRSIATSTTAVVESAANTTVSGMAILESHASIRSSSDAHAERLAAWKRSVFNDAQSQAKALGYNSVSELDAEVEQYFNRHK